MHSPSEPSRSRSHQRSYEHLGPDEQERRGGRRHRIGRVPVDRHLCQLGVDRLS